MCGRCCVGGCCIYASGSLCANKIYTSNPIDPPSVLYDPETRESIAQLASRTITPDHADGALLFYNRDTGQLEVYKMSEGVFCSLSGEVLETLPRPNLPRAEDVSSYFRFDRRTGRIVEGQRLKRSQPRVKRGYKVDSSNGNFIRASDGVQVDKEEAVELPE